MSASNRDGNSQTLEWVIPLIGVVGSVVLAWYLGLLQAREEYQRQQTPAAYADAAKNDAERACVGTDAAAVFVCVNEKVKTAYQTAHDEQDLSAQQRAASAALISTLLSFIALVLSGVGVWYVKRTLDATLDAVEDTGLATEAMLEANKIARTIGEAQVRAYLSVESAELLVSEGLPVVQFAVKNAGQSPATDVIIRTYSAGIMLANFNDISEIFPKTIEFGESKANPFSISAGETIEGVMVLMMPHPTIDQSYECIGSDLANDSLIRMFKLSYHVTWFDIFGTKRDAAGMVIVDGFQGVFPANDAVTARYPGRATTSGFDTEAMIKRHTEAQA